MIICWVYSRAWVTLLKTKKWDHYLCRERDPITLKSLGKYYLFQDFTSASREASWDNWVVSFCLEMWKSTYVLLIIYQNKGMSSGQDKTQSWILHLSSDLEKRRTRRFTWTARCPSHIWAKDKHVVILLCCTVGLLHKTLASFATPIINFTSSLMWFLCFFVLPG